MSASVYCDRMPGTVFCRGDRVTLNTVNPDDYTFVEALHNEPTVRQQAGISLPWNQTDVRELVGERDDVVVFLVCHDGEAVTRSCSRTSTRRPARQRSRT